MAYTPRLIIGRVMSLSHRVRQDPHLYLSVHFSQPWQIRYRSLSASSAISLLYNCSGRYTTILLNNLLNTVTRPMTENESFGRDLTSLGHKAPKDPEHSVLKIPSESSCSLPTPLSLPEVVPLGKFKGVYDMRHVHCCNYINHYPKRAMTPSLIQQEMRKRCPFCRHLPYVSSGLRYTVDIRHCGFRMAPRYRAVPSEIGSCKSAANSRAAGLIEKPPKCRLPIAEPDPGKENGGGPNAENSYTFATFESEVLPTFQAVKEVSFDAESTKLSAWQWSRSKSISRAISLLTTLAMKLRPHSQNGPDPISSV